MIESGGTGLSRASMSISLVAMLCVASIEDVRRCWSWGFTKGTA